MKNYISIIFLALLLCLCSFTATWSSPVQIDPTLSREDLDQRAIRYQIELSTRMTEQLRYIFEEFRNSYYDYVAPLDKMNLMIHEYSKALYQMPVPIPEDGEKLHHLTKLLLSRIEKYFAYVKLTGRENPEISSQIYQSMFEISRERERLAYKYKFII